ncbi:MAG: transporter substrate-binding domain-containing protein [Deltaproteobacteria bacterium]|nr:transporter substrate-binding domain-containing protein [Deltaproteobacteria bacterium]
MKTIILVAIMAMAIFSPPIAGADDPLHLRINCTVHSPYEAFFVRLLEEICSRNNIVLERNTPPVGRSLSLVNEGVDDGDGPRIAGLSSAYPHLVCVPEPFGVFRFGAFARSRDIHINDWAGLADLNVAYIHGWKIFDNQVKAARSITKVKDKALLFKLLDAGRTDVALITKLAGYAEIQKLGLKGIHFIEPPLAVKPTFLYLNQRHRDVALKLARTLQELKQDGTYDRLYQEIISPYLRGSEK